MLKEYKKLMRRCISLAKKSEGHVSPNPLVGAVIFDDDFRIISEGRHEKYGENHAERNAVLNASGNGKVFTVVADNVRLENLTFINGRDTVNLGGAIYWSGNYGKLVNCTFRNNTYWGKDSFSGGAVKWSGQYGNISNCVFESNVANFTSGTADGGAVWLNGANSVVEFCKFYNNF